MKTIDIDIPGLKEVLWHKMRDDLKAFVPSFKYNDLALCPACCRPLKFGDFSVEHIIPKQALKNDPAAARAAIPHNQRSGVTLLCQKPLIVKGQQMYRHGCNSWKGKYYDASLAQMFKHGFQMKNYTSRHQVSLFCAGYLGLFRRYGYQITLSASGLVMREQFFSPNRFRGAVPLRSQIILTGDAPLDYSDDLYKYWANPFQFIVHDHTSVLMVVRNCSTYLPVSRNPETPFARSLRYAPSKYKMRPDLRTAFE